MKTLIQNSTISKVCVSAKNSFSYEILEINKNNIIFQKMKYVIYSHTLLFIQ